VSERESFCAELDAMFEVDLEVAARIRPAFLHQRRWYQRAVERLAWWCRWWL